jgi:glycosyltransferase involved in cell wall biosynthesis
MMEALEEKAEMAKADRAAVRPTLSFVIPAFNEEKLLPRTLESINRWAPPVPHEIILVDNGSTDGTARLASEMGARVVRRTSGTIGALRNTGVAHSEGSVLVFLDADVVLTPEWAARIPRSLESIRQEPRLVTGAWCGVPSDASWLERWWFAPRIGATHLGTGHMIMTRRFFDELGGFDESLATGEDYDLSRRAVGQGGRIDIDERLRAEHLGFPRTLWAFVRREAWHGIGDFSSLGVWVRSKVAVTALAFALLHLVFLAGLATGSVAAVIVAAVGIVAICLGSSLWKYGHGPVHVILHNAVVYWFYYLGRGLGVVPGAARMYSTRRRQ